MPWPRTLRLWASLAAVPAFLLLAVAWSERLPSPEPASAPATEFSAVRAWPTLAYLGDTLGHRLPGSPQAARARAHLVARLRSVPGLEVVEQDALGMRGGERGMVAFRARNVLARLPGREPGAVLLSSHYDSPAASVGAADDGIAVAAMVEVARALAAGPRPRHSVIFNFDDAEEQGLLGASAFLGHAWARDVRAFVDLESAGNVGKAVLFQAGPGNAWLTGRYARSVPHPYGTVLGQDIFQSGLIPSGTDFEVYQRDGGMRGLDIAFYRGGWAYHTPLDRVAAVAPGSIQHMGANALALARALADGPLPGDIGGTPSVYYDVLGLWMATYGRNMAVWFALAAVVLLGMGVRALLDRRLIRGRTLRTALLATLAGVVLAVVVALAGAALTAYVVRRPHGWFAHPWRGVVAYGALALLPILLAQRRFASRAAARDETPETRVLTAWVAAHLVSALALLLLTAAGIGSAYLLLWWVAGGAASLALLARSGGRRWLLPAAIGLLPGALLTLQTGYLAIELFAPIAGRFPGSLPFDLVIAAIAALIVGMIAPAAVALMHRDGRPGAAAAVTGATAVVAVVTIWLSFPYSPTRPQRLQVVHEGTNGGGRLVLRAGDMLGPVRAARAAAGNDGGSAGVPAAAGGADGALYFAAGAPPVPPASRELLGERRTASGERVLSLRLRSGDAYSTTVELPATRAGLWSVDGAPPPADGARSSRMRFVATPDSGWTFSLTVPGAEPLPIHVRSRRAGATPAARALMDRLPRWSAAHAESVARIGVTY